MTLTREVQNRLFVTQLNIQWEILQLYDEQDLLKNSRVVNV
jgi:hypothetical protein